MDQTFTDFDGVAYHIESSKEGPLTLSMDIRCWVVLAAQGADELLRQIYGTWVQPTAENGYNITLSFDYAAVPPAGGAYCRPASTDRCSGPRRACARRVTTEAERNGRAI